MDFLYWGGPVTKDIVQAIRWERPTFVWVNSLGGMDNAKFYQSLVDDTYASKRTPLGELLVRAQVVANGHGVAFDPSDVQSIGLATFSAGHQLINPLLTNDADANRVKIVIAIDSCFVLDGVTTAHRGYEKFARMAADSTSGKMFVVTSHGPRGSIHYAAAGHNYDLMSGTSSFELVWNAISRGATGAAQTSPSTAPEQPTESHRIGNLIWFGYDQHDHAWQIKQLAKPIIGAYAPPFMSRGTSACEVAAPIPQVSSKQCFVGHRQYEGDVAGSDFFGDVDPDPAPLGTPPVVGGQKVSGAAIATSAIVTVAAGAGAGVLTVKLIQMLFGR